MPLPIANETKDEYVKRFMSDPEMVKKHPDEKQRYAICMSEWKKHLKDSMKLETVSPKGIEIFEAGTWKGHEFTENDLDEMVSNFKSGIIEPYITIDHSDKATQEFKDALKAMSLGFVENIQRVGKKLVADFKQVPKTIADLIEAGALKKKSIEVYKKYKAADGSEHNNVMEAVTFHGANGVPAIHTLSDFIALYKNDFHKTEPNGQIVNEVLSIETQSQNYKQEGAISMDKIEITKEEYDSLITLKNTSAQTSEEIMKFKTENDDLKKALADEKTKRELSDKALETFKAESDKMKADALNAEAASYVDSQINLKRIQPASKELYVKNYLTYKNDSNLFETFKKDIEAREHMIFQDEPQDGDAGKATFKTGDTEDAMRKIETIMKRENCDFMAAREKLFGKEGA